MTTAFILWACAWRERSLPQGSRGGTVSMRGLSSENQPQSAPETHRAGTTGDQTG